MSNGAEFDYGWFGKKWQDAKVVILGADIYAFAAADSLVEQGAKLLVLAESVQTELASLFDVIGAELVLAPEAELIQVLESQAPELIISSANISPTSAILASCFSREIPVWSEAELAWRLRNKFVNAAEWVLITGSSAVQVAKLVSKIMLAADRGAVLVGMDSSPVLDAIRHPEQPEFLIIPQSAAQLHLMQSAEPLISVYLDSAEADTGHSALLAKLADSAKVFHNTKKYAIYNRSDQYAEKLLENADVIEGARAIGFWFASPCQSEVGVVEDLLVDRAFLENRANEALEIITLAELKQAGYDSAQDLEIFLAAATILRGLDCSPAAIRDGLFSE